MEMFHVEEFEKLRQGIERLLSAREGPFTNATSSDEYRKFINAVDMTGSMKLGVVVRGRKGRFFFGDPFGELPRLPHEVKSINLELHKVLPSTLVVAMDVYLTDEATESLLKVQSNRYLSKLWFYKLFPRGQAGGGYSRTGSRIEMRKEVLNWLNQFRSKVEEAIEPYLNGYFSQNSTERIAKLPAVEIFTLTGIPSNKEAFNNWRIESRQWYKSFGFRFRSDAYRNDNLLLLMPQDDVETHRRAAYRLVILKEPDLSSIEKEGPGVSKTEAIIESIQETLDDLLPGIVLLQLIESIQSKVEELREKVFGTIKSRYKLRAYSKLNKAILHISLLLDIFASEFEDWRRVMSMQSGNFIKIRSRPAENDESTFISEKLGHLKDKIPQLRKEVSHIRTWFSEHLATRNLEAVYWLTFIATIAALVGLANWSIIQDLLSYFWKLITHK
jgi:hypothetical protein